MDKGFISLAAAALCSVWTANAATVTAHGTTAATDGGVTASNPIPKSATTCRYFGAFGRAAKTLIESSHWG